MDSLLLLGDDELVQTALETASSEYSPENIAVLEEACRGVNILGVPVTGGYACAKEFLQTHKSAAVAIMNSALRLHWMNRLQSMGFQLATLIHPRCLLSTHAAAGEGSFLQLGAMVNAGTSIGRGCVICTGCIISSGCMLMDGANICCGAHLSRGCRIGYRAQIGAGAVICAGVMVGNDAVVCPGSVVERDVCAGMIVSGAPACVVGNAVYD